MHKRLRVVFSQGRRELERREERREREREDREERERKGGRGRGVLEEKWVKRKAGGKG